MSIIVNGKEYPDERSVPEQYRMQTQMGTRQRDPGNFSPDLAPNVGRSVLPHVTTFSGMMSTLARTYRQHDEAIRHNKHNANMMRRDPMIMGPLFARQMAVALLQWQVQPEDSSDEKQVQVAKELTFMVSRIPRFREYLRNLMEAVWYGRYGIQNVWGFTRDSRGVRYRTVVDWVPVNGDKLLFRYDDGTGRYDHDEIGVKVSVAHVKDDIWAGKPDIEWNSEGTGVFLRRWERSRLVVHKNFMMDGDYEDPTTAGMIHGVGLRHFLYWSWYQKQETLAQLAEVVERAGMGFTVYTYPAGNAQAREEVERLAEEQAHKNQIVLPMEVSNPDAYSIQQIPPNTQGIMALQSLIDDYFGSWIIKFILGQTLSYRAEAGTPGISDLHRDSFLQIVKYDSLGVEETVTKDLIRMLLMFNFPSYQNVNFQFKLNTEEAVPLEKLQALQAAWSMGAKIKSEDVMGLIGLNVAGATDQALYNPQVLASLKEYEMMEEQQEKEEQGGQGAQITESQDEALAAMLGPVMQSKKAEQAEGYAKKEKSGNYKPNQGMKGNAKRGLELRKKHGKGGTSVGVARARDIMNGKDLSFSTVKRMHSFFSRHAGNEEGGEDDAGYIAWLLWGGDSGRNWARSIVESERKNQSRGVGNEGDPSVIDTPEENLTDPAPQRRGGDSLLGAIASGAMEGATRGAARRLTGQQGFQFAKDEDDDGLRQGGLFDDVPVKDDYIPKKKEPKEPSNEKQRRLWSEDDLHNLQQGLEQKEMFEKKNDPDRYDEDDQADFESQYKVPERHPEGGWNTPEWQDWKPEGAKVYENFIPRETHVVNKDTLELQDLKHALNKSIDWMKLSPSKDDFIGQIDHQVKKGKEILGEENWPKKNADVKEEDIDKLFSAGVSVFSDESIDWTKDAAGKEWDRHSRRLVENPKKIKQLEEQLKEFGDLAPKTGKPIVIAGYHGTTSGRLESFDPEKRGSYTGAGSAALGDFHAGSETTSQAYMDMPKFPFRGYLQLEDEQKKDFANELEDRYRQDIFNQVLEMSDDEIREIWELDEDDEVDEYRTEDNYQSMHNLNEVMDYDDWLNEKLDFNPEFFRDIGNNILDAYGEEDKEFSIDKIKPYIHKNYIKFENPYVHDYKGERYREESYHDIIKAAKKAGHDGVLLMNTYDGGSKDHVIVSFSPDQIKNHDNPKPTSDPRLEYDKEPERNAMGAGPRDHSPEDLDVTNKQINGQATANRGTMPRQATQSSMPSKADKGSVSTNPVSKTGMSSDATRMDRGASLANMRDKFMKYRKTKLIEMLQPFVQEDPDFSLTDAQGKKRRTSLFKADKYSLANTLASKYAEGESPMDAPMEGMSHSEDWDISDEGLQNFRPESIEKQDLTFKGKGAAEKHYGHLFDENFTAKDLHQGVANSIGDSKALNKQLNEIYLSNASLIKDHYEQNLKAEMSPSEKAKATKAFKSAVVSPNQTPVWSETLDSIAKSYFDSRSFDESKMDDLYTYGGVEGGVATSDLLTSDHEHYDLLSTQSGDTITDKVIAAAKAGREGIGKNTPLKKAAYDSFLKKKFPGGVLTKEQHQEMLEEEQRQKEAEEQRQQDELTTKIAEANIDNPGASDEDEAAAARMRSEGELGGGAEGELGGAREIDPVTGEPGPTPVQQEGIDVSTASEREGDVDLEGEGEKVRPVPEGTEQALEAGRVESQQLQEAEEMREAFGQDTGFLDWANDYVDQAEEDIAVTQALELEDLKTAAEKADFQRKEEELQGNSPFKPTTEGDQAAKDHANWVQQKGDDISKALLRDTKLSLYPSNLGNEVVHTEPFLNDNRITVGVSFNGVKIPFYVSTGSGGKASVEPHKFYPYFGTGEDGWLNKGTEDQINNFYGSPVLKKMADVLNEEHKDLLEAHKKSSLQAMGQVPVNIADKKSADAVRRNPDSFPQGLINPGNFEEDLKPQRHGSSITHSDPDQQDAMRKTSSNQDDLNKGNTLIRLYRVLRGEPASGLSKEDDDALQALILQGKAGMEVARGEQADEEQETLKGLREQTVKDRNKFLVGLQRKRLEKEAEDRLDQEGLANSIKSAMDKRALEQEAAREQAEAEYRTARTIRREEFEERQAALEEQEKLKALYETSSDTAESYHTKALPNVDSDIELKVTVGGKGGGKISFGLGDDGNYILKLTDSAGNSRLFNADQATKRFGKNFKSIANAVIKKDNERWQEKAMLAGLATPIDVSQKDLGTVTGQTYFTRETKDKINNHVVNAMKGLGSRMGGIDITDYTEYTDAVDAAFDKMRGHVADLDKKGGFFDSIKSVGFKKDPKLSTADNYMNAIEHVMGQAGKAGFKPNKKLNTIENMQNGLQFLAEKTGNEREWSPWAIAGGVSILAMLLLFYSVMKD